MNKNMAEFLTAHKKQKHATDRGTDIHRQLQFLQLDETCEFSQKIKTNPEIAQFWGKESRAEVPIAGFVDGKFYSKRIDRLVVLPQRILFIDYKTDTDRGRRPDYEKTMKIYARLLHAAYPDHDVSGYILWLHDWELEKII